MTPADVLEILDALEQAGLTTWLDGGWGVDALVRRQTRQHTDLDLAIDWELLPKAMKAMQRLGFHHDADAEPGMPARLVMVDPLERQLDLHPLRFDGAGNGWQQLSPAGDTWGHYPAQDLEGQGSVGGREVACISPRLQVQFHLGYEWSQTDEHDVRLLTKEFGLPMPDVSS